MVLPRFATKKRDVMNILLRFIEKYDMTYDLIEHTAASSYGSSRMWVLWVGIMISCWIIKGLATCHLDSVGPESASNDLTLVVGFLKDARLKIWRHRYYIYIIYIHDIIWIICGISNDIHTYNLDIYIYIIYMINIRWIFFVSFIRIHRWNESFFSVGVGRRIPFSDYWDRYGKRPVDELTM
jgi:hypothetical protein